MKTKKITEVMFEDSKKSIERYSIGSKILNFLPDAPGFISEIEIIKCKRRTEVQAWIEDSKGIFRGIVIWSDVRIIFKTERINEKGFVEKEAKDIEIIKALEKVKKEI